MSVKYVTVYKIQEECDAKISWRSVFEEYITFSHTNLIKSKEEINLHSYTYKDSLMISSHRHTNWVIFGGILYPLRSAFRAPRLGGLNGGCVLSALMQMSI